jgi:tetratricopeptide (TPR) repeat protein
MMPVRFVLMTAVTLLSITFAPTLPVGAADAPPAAAEPSKDAPPPKKEEETPADRIERQLKNLQERFQQVSIDEMKLTMELMAAQQQANELRPEARKPVLRQIAERMLGFGKHFAALVKSLKPLEKDKAQATPEQRKRIDELADRIYAKYRSDTQKVAERFEQLGDTRAAYETWTAYYQAMPDYRRDRGLKERLAQQAEKCGDLYGTRALLKSIFEAVPEKDRYRDRGLGEKIGDLEVRLGDWTKALALYQRLLEALPADKRDTDGKSLKEKIAIIEKKLGRNTAAQPKAAAATKPAATPKK